jgi:hypothetical protein
VAADDDDRAGGASGDPIADRADEQADEPAQSAGADD